MLDTKVILCDLTHDYQVVATNKMPLGVAMIASYAKKIFPQISVSIFKQIAELEKCLEKLFAEQNEYKIIFGFSNFIWNQNLNLKIAEIIKKISPASIVVFGGPNFPLDEDERVEFLFSSPQVDFYIPFEGELSFVNLLEIAYGCNFDIEKIKNSKPSQTVYIHDSVLVSTEPLNRINISEIPSPYTTGLMDGFFGVYKPLVQFTRGCPFKCAYCSEGGDHWSRVYRKSVEDVEEELEYIAAKSDCRETLHISDSNFGMYQNDIAYAKIIASKRQKYNWPSSILVATGKNSKETVIEVAKILDGQMPLSASVQSTDLEVLKNVKRKNIKLEDIFAVGLSAKKYGANTYADIILALPGDTMQAHKKTLKDVIDADIDFTTPFQFMMLKGTHLATSSSKKEYQMLSRYRVLPRCFGSYHFLNNKFIVAEIEEICVANLTLSFDDYIEARRLHLLIDIFYNHRSLQEIYLVLSELGIGNFSFLEELHRLNKDLLSKVFDDFENETKNELWCTKEELSNFVSDEENLQKYKNGEIGANLLYKYRITALMHYSNEVVCLAYEAFENLLKNKLGSDYHKYKDFIFQLKDLSLCRIDRFMDTSLRFDRTYDYDLMSLGELTMAELIAQKKKIKVVIRHEDEYKAVIEYYLNENGISLISLSKILSQVNVKKCFRKGMYAAS